MAAMILLYGKTIVFALKNGDAVKECEIEIGTILRNFEGCKGEIYFVALSLDNN